MEAGPPALRDVILENFMDRQLMDFIDRADGAAGRHMNFVDPGSLPEKLTMVPGFVSELADWTMRYGHSPNRTLAFTGALAMLAHLAGRSYADESGARTNLYIIALGVSGIGKDDPRKTNKRLAERLDWSQSMIESVASGEALEDAVAAHPSLFFQPDEVAGLFGQMRGQGKVAKSLSGMVRRLFSSSDSEYVPRKKASDGRRDAGLPRAQPIRCPHLTIFGTGVPEEMLDALTPQEIRNGLFGRCLVLNVPDDNVRQTGSAFEALPQNVLRVGAMLVDRESRTQESGVIGMQVVPSSDEAKAAKRWAMEAFGRQRRLLQEADLMNAHAIVSRIDEKISKLALIYAISENPCETRITCAAVEWAVAFVVHVVRWMLYEAQFHVSEGKFGKLVERAKSIMSRNNGVIDRRSLIQKLHCDVATFTRLIRTLLVAEEIEPPAEIDGKLVYQLVK